MSRLPLAAAALMAVAASSCATRGEGDQTRGDENRFVTAAATPLRDVGIIRPDVPQLLEHLNYPYQQEGLTNGCTAIAYEIGRLDAVLGEESYQPGEERSLSSRAGDAAENFAVDQVASAADFIPYRGWVRRLSGASRAERKAAAAYAMGEQRRTFLRGYGAALGCPSILPAPPPAEPEENEDRDRERQRG